jgi:hypothetical protein
VSFAAFSMSINEQESENQRLVLSPPKPPPLVNLLAQSCLSASSGRFQKEEARRGNASGFERNAKAHGETPNQFQLT